jgi:hypothetical protein
MPFGEHRGRLVAEIPSPYLRWCLRESGNLEPYLRAAIRGELTPRDWEADEEVACEVYPMPTDLSALLPGWYHGLARDYHPDRGGSVEAMQVVNEAHERLKQQLTRSQQLVA